MPFLAMLLAAQTPGDANSWKLVVSWSQGGTTVIDYPNEQRCRRGQAAIEQEAQRRQNESSGRPTPNGGVIVGTRWTIYGFCIPG